MMQIRSVKRDSSSALWVTKTAEISRWRMMRPMSSGQRLAGGQSRGPQGLIEEQDFWLDDHGPSQADALRFATRQVLLVAFGQVGDAEIAQSRMNTPGDFRSGQAAEDQSLGDIFKHRTG